MSDDTKYLKLSTRAIHSGSVPEDDTGSVTTAIFPSSTYRVAYPGDESGYVYSRSANPTRCALERALASLEEGTAGFAFASGLAALNCVLNLLKAGDHVVAVDDLYGGSLRQFNKLWTQFGLEFDYVDCSDVANFEKAIKPNTRLVWIETPTNPLLHLIDIEALSKITRKHDILLAVDNTFATPVIQQPLNLGADIVHHSASKYLGGHCDLIGGVLVVRNDALAERIRFVQNANGLMLGPFESWLMLRGIKTLQLRVERHCSNAARIARELQSYDIVDRVYYPGIDGQPLPNRMTASGGIVSFNIKTDFETVKKFVMATRLFVLAESLGGVESLVNHPASMTHASIDKEIREARGIGDGLVRFSVGVEDIDDLLADLKQAFKQIC